MLKLKDGRFGERNPEEFSRKLAKLNLLAFLGVSEPISDRCDETRMMCADIKDSSLLSFLFCFIPFLEYTSFYCVLYCPGSL